VKSRKTSSLLLPATLLKHLWAPTRAIKGGLAVFGRHLKRIKPSEKYHRKKDKIV
jgi:hypothetical protein